MSQNMSHDVVMEHVHIKVMRKDKTQSYKNVANSKVHGGQRQEQCIKV